MPKGLLDDIPVYNKARDKAWEAFIKRKDVKKSGMFGDGFPLERGYYELWCQAWQRAWDDGFKEGHEAGREEWKNDPTFGPQPGMRHGLNKDDWKDIVAAISKVRDGRDIYLGCRPADVFQDWFLAMGVFKSEEKNT